MSRSRTPPPKGFRRVERWFVGLVLAVVALILERVVLRAVRKEGKGPDVDVGTTTFTSKGGDVDLPEP